jgi:hypothetical protein
MGDLDSWETESLTQDPEPSSNGLPLGRSGIYHDPASVVVI